MRRMLRLFAVLLGTALALTATTASVRAEALDAPELAPVAAGQGKVRLTIEAGASGAMLSLGWASWGMEPAWLPFRSTNSTL